MSTDTAASVATASRRSERRSGQTGTSGRFPTAAVATHTRTGASTRTSTGTEQGTPTTLATLDTYMIL